MTFSLFARCSTTGMFGVAISSSSPVAAARCSNACAGFAAGSEAGSVHSAGMMLADTVSWPVADLGFDWTEDCPIEATSKAWDIYNLLLDDYVRRALDPSEAPFYGVSGDI